MCVLQWGGWGEGNESRALCTMLRLERSQTRCPEVADSFEMAPTGICCAMEDGCYVAQRLSWVDGFSSQPLLWVL